MRPKTTVIQRRQTKKVKHISTDYIRLQLNSANKPLKIHIFVSTANFEFISWSIICIVMADTNLIIPIFYFYFNLFIASFHLKESCLQVFITFILGLDIHYCRRLDIYYVGWVMIRYKYNRAVARCVKLGVAVDR